MSLPRGSGYGPPEINLGQSGIFPTLADYQNFFVGQAGPGGVKYEGRYGEFGQSPPRAGSVPYNRADDILDLIKRYDWPTTASAYNYYTSPASNYGSPCDLWGRAVMGVDYAGQPIWSFFNSAASDTLGVAANELPNNPYTLNLSRRRGRSSAQGTMPGDSAFTVAELERILRHYDVDATSLPDRLRFLIEFTSANPDLAPADHDR